MATRNRKGRRGRGVMSDKHGPTHTVWEPLSLDSDERMLRAKEERDRLVASAVRRCRIKSEAGRLVSARQLELLLTHRDFLSEALLKGELASEESRQINSNHRNIIQLTTSMGLTELYEDGECTSCDGSGTRGGETCEACGGTGVEGA